MSSTSQGSTAMDVDSTPSTSHNPTLKRCSSAPMINENISNMTNNTPTPITANRDTNAYNIFGSFPRTRRFSASFTSNSSNSPGNLRLTPRINQLRQEECVDPNIRERAHEREIHHTMQISQSWEDLTLVSENTKQLNKMSPLNIALPNIGYFSNSPSPTRLSSPGFQSPTRTKASITRRSASPILRPSPLSAKRKLEEDKASEYHLSPRAKRITNYNSASTTVLSGDRGGLLTMSSPIPGSLSSIGTPESISSADSPNFQFRMLDSPSPNRPIHEPMLISKGDQDMEGPS